MREALYTNESSHRTRQRPTPESFYPLTCERGRLSVGVGHRRLEDRPPWLAAVGATAGGWQARDWSAPSSSAQIHPLLPQPRLSATASGSVDAVKCLVSTASVERAFSTLKIIKTRLRNTMKNDYQANSLLLNIESGIAEKYIYEDVLMHFKGVKKRRADL